MSAPAAFAAAIAAVVREPSAFVANPSITASASPPMMSKLEMVEAPVGNRLICKCGGERFFILAEAEEVPPFEPISSIECVGCHTMYHLRLAKCQT